MACGNRLYIFSTAGSLEATSISSATKPEKKLSFTYGLKRGSYDTAKKFKRFVNYYRQLLKVKQLDFFSVMSLVCSLRVAMGVRVSVPLLPDKFSRPYRLKRAQQRYNDKKRAWPKKQNKWQHILHYRAPEVNALIFSKIIEKMNEHYKHHKILNANHGSRVSFVCIFIRRAQFWGTVFWTWVIQKSYLV